MRHRIGVAMVPLLALGVGLVPVLAQPAAAMSPPEVVATGLNNPYKLTFGPDGDLFVAEAGTGGTGSCTLLGEGTAPACYGATGSVTRIPDGTGTPTRVITGLPSAAPAGGNGATGPMDVAFAPDGTTYIVTGLGGDNADRVALGAGGARLGTVLAVAPDEDEATVLADLVAFEEENNPDQEDEGSAVDSNPFGIEYADGNLLVNDAGGNDLLHAWPGEVELVGTYFEARNVPAPPFLGLPAGATIPMQAVPTAIEQDPDGNLFVSQLTGFPFPVGAANVFAIDADGDHSVAEAGFTNIVDLTFDAEGTMYVLQYTSNGAIGGPNPAPRLVQVRPDGTRKVLLSNELSSPGGVTIGPDGWIYVTNGSVQAGGGTVVRFDPTVARDPAIQGACPPANVPGSGFTDVPGNVHQEAIECMAWREIVRGVSATTFAVDRVLTRGEVATILARLVEMAGADLDPTPPTPFSDTANSIHALGINQLAAAGVIQGYSDGTFRPNNPVSRAGVASLLVRAYDLVSSGNLEPGPDAFDDDDGDVHEDDINDAAHAGWVKGTGPRTFAPGAFTTRAQFASMVARLTSSMVKNGGMM